MGTFECARGYQQEVSAASTATGGTQVTCLTLPPDMQADQPRHKCTPHTHKSPVLLKDKVQELDNNKQPQHQPALN